MPWVEENGLLPGRGAPGRAGRGPGLNPAPVLGAPPSVPSSVEGSSLAAGASGAVSGWAGSTGAASSAGSASFVRGPGRGAAFAAGASVSSTFTSAGAASSPASGAGAAFLAGAFLAAFLAALASALASSSAPYLSSNFFSTGGSTVELGAFTNSPRSFSIFRTSFDGTSYFLASSWTRTLATCFLLVRIRHGDGAWTAS